MGLTCEQHGRQGADSHLSLWLCVASAALNRSSRLKCSFQFHPPPHSPPLRLPCVFNTFSAYRTELVPHLTVSSHCKAAEQFGNIAMHMPADGCSLP